MIKFLAGEGLDFKPTSLDEFDFEIHVDNGYIDNEESVEVVTDADASVDEITTAYSDPFYDLSIIAASSVASAVDASAVVLTALDATGELVGNRLNKVSDGICRVKAKHPFLSRMVALDMTRINANVYRVLRNYVAGSVCRDINDNMAAMADGKGAATKPLYSTQDHNGAVYVRNVDCWAASLNLTACSPWNSTGQQFRAGTAISPLHTLHAWHYQIGVGATIRFVAADNTLITRTVADASVVSVGETDIQMALLDSPLPASITPSRFLPANAWDYFPSKDTWPIQLLALDAQERALTRETFQSYKPLDWSLYAMDSALWPDLSETIVSGDSGNPIFMVIADEAVLVSHWSTAIRGPLYHLALDSIQDAMDSLGGGQTLQTVDLSSFTDFA
jgi:hypothetical protein